jgi:hypothetical protein
MGCLVAWGQEACRWADERGVMRRRGSAINFRKTGREIKDSVQMRCEQLTQRLARRNANLDVFLNNGDLVRSYMVRQSMASGHSRTDPGLWTDKAISSEQMEEVRQTCVRIYAIEQELLELRLLLSHLDDEAVFELSPEELISYGFQV